MSWAFQPLLPATQQLLPAGSVTESVSASDSSDAIINYIVKTRSNSSLEDFALNAYTGYTNGQADVLQTNNAFGQRFVASKTGKLGYIRARAFRSLNTNRVTTTGTIELWSLVDNTTSNAAISTLLASAPLTMPSSTTDGPLLIDVTSVANFTVTAGTAYVIAVRTGSDWSTASNDYLMFGQVFSSSNPDQKAELQSVYGASYSYNGSSWSSAIDVNRQFDVEYVRNSDSATLADSELISTNKYVTISESGSLTESTDRSKFAAAYVTQSKIGYNTLFGSPNNQTWSNANTVKDAFTFRSQDSGLAKLFKGSVTKSPSETGTNPVVIEIWTLDTNSLTGTPQTLLGSVSVPANQISTNPNDILFADLTAANVTLTEGSYYAIVFNRPAGWTTALQYAYGNPLPDYSAFSNSMQQISRWRWTSNGTTWNTANLITYNSILIDVATDSLSPNLVTSSDTTETGSAQDSQDRLYSGAVRVNERISKNRYLNSEDATSWSLSNVTVNPDSVANPLDGALTADQLSNTPGVNSSVTVPGIAYGAYRGGTTFTKSIYAKLITGSQYLAFQSIPVTAAGTQGTPYFTATFDLFNGIVSSNSAPTTAAITSVGNGWYRCSITFTVPSTNGNGNNQSIIGDSIFIGAYGQTPTATTIAVWGAQVEEGSSATAYEYSGANPSIGGSFLDLLNTALTTAASLTETSTATDTVAQIAYDATPQSVLYWVGGSGTMSSTLGGKWALTSGGAPTLFAPSSITDVYFDANSDAGAPFTVTIGGATTCKSINVSGLDQQMTITGTSALTVYGSLSLPSTNFVSTYTGNVSYSAPYSQTISLNGNQFGTNFTLAGGSDVAGTNYATGTYISVAYSPTYGYVIGVSSVTYHIRYSPDGVLWTYVTLPEMTSFAPSSIIWETSVGLFVAVSGGGNIHTSPDGVNWTKRTSGTTNPLYAVLWDGSKFVIFGSNVILTSTDGINWSLTSSAFTATANAFFNGTTYVVGSGTTNLQYSTDLTNWTSTTVTGVTGTISAISWSPTLSIWVIGTNSGYFSGSTDLTNWTSSLGTANSVNEIIWANNRFQTFGYFGYIYTSTNGTTWTFASSGGNYVDSYNAATYTGTQYVAVGDNYNVRFGNSTSLSKYSLNGIAHNGSTYVVAGSLGVIYTSPDKFTWTKRTSGTTNTLYEVLWTGSLFIVGGASGTLLTSPDGITWTSRTSNTTNSITRLSLVNGVIFGSLSSTSSTNIITSTDGINWTLRNIAASVFATSGVGYINGLYLVGTSTSTVYYTSPDLVTWTLRNPALSSYFNWFVTFKGVLYAGANKTGSNTIYKSSDGINWTVSLAATGNSITTLVGDNNYLISYSGTNVSHYIDYTADGVNWFFKLYGGNGMHAAVTTTMINNEFLTVGLCGQIITGTLSLGSYDINTPFNIGGSLTLTQGWLTTNANVTASSYAATVNAIPKAVNMTNSNWYITGTGTVWSDVMTSNQTLYDFNAGTSTITLSNNTTSPRTISSNNSFNNLNIGGDTSTSTTSLTPGIPGGSTPVTGPSMAVSNLTSTKTVAHTINFGAGHIFNIGNWGVQGSAGNLVTIRPTGTTSISRFISVTNNFTPTDCIWGNTEYVAVGGTGLINTSFDGITWTTRTSGTTATLNGIGYGSGLYVAVGASGTILTSPNGITWTSRTSGTTNALNDVCWCGTQFLVVGASGTILTSSDAITWTPQTISGVSTSLDRCASSGTYHMLGGASGVLYRGSDLNNIASWTLDTIQTTLSVNEIAYGNGYFVIGLPTSNNSNLRYTNNNGTSWSTGGTSVAGPTVPRIVYSASFGGWIAASSSLYIYATSSGIPSSFGFQNSLRCYAVAAGNRQTVCIAPTRVYLSNMNAHLVKV